MMLDLKNVSDREPSGRYSDLDPTGTVNYHDSHMSTKGVPEKLCVIDEKDESSLDLLGAYGYLIYALH